jgi:hypothetical protein
MNNYVKYKNSINNIIFLLRNIRGLIMDKPISVLEIVDIIFARPPQEACSIQVALCEESNANLFHLLMDIMMQGSKRLFGNEVSAQNITLEQFEILKKYMRSIGYEIKHNFTTTLENTVLVNIWFEPYIGTMNCHGHRFT